jgi:hypothetical protein
LVEFLDRKVVEFNFAVIQLNRLSWRDFLTKDNPIASALMAKMGIEAKDRVTAKKECLRMIARLKLDSARTHLLGGFVDSYIKLLEKERKELNAELKKLPKREREEVMEITTSWEEIGIQKGIQIGVQQGVQQGRKQGLQQGLQQGVQRESELVLRQIQRKFGKITNSDKKQILALPIEKIEELGELLFDFQNLDELHNWLNQVSPKN